MSNVHAARTNFLGDKRVILASILFTDVTVWQNRKAVFDICSVNIAKEIFDLQELCAFNSWNKFAGWYIAYDYYYTLSYRKFW